MAAISPRDVPYSGGIPDVESEGAPRGDLPEVPAIPAAFGVQRAEAVQKFGAQTEQAGSQLFDAWRYRQNLSNQMTVSDGAVNLTKQLASAWDDFSKTEGKDAEAGFDGYNKTIQGYYKAAVDAMPNLAAKAAASEAYRSLTDRYTWYGERQREEQFKVWRSQSRKDYDETQSNQAVQASNTENPDPVADWSMRQIANAGAEKVAKDAIQEGLDPTAAVQEFYGKTYEAAIRLKLDKQDIQGAAALYRDVGPLMDLKSKVSVENELSPKKFGSDRDAYVDYYTGQPLDKSFTADTAARGGVPAEYPSTIIELERPRDPNHPDGRPGSQYKGLLQASPIVRAKYGLDESNWNDLGTSARVAVQEAAENVPALTKALGRAPTGPELYLAHQQGLAGATAILTHPDDPAWRSLAKYMGPGKAQQHVRDNEVGPLKGLPVDQITGRDFAQAWTDRYNRVPQGGTNAPMSEEDSIKGALANPNLQANPKLLNAVIAGIKQRNTLFNQVNADQIHQIKEEAKENIPLIAEGAINLPFDESKIRAYVRGWEGQQMIDEYHVARAVGEQVHMAKFASPQQFADIKAELNEDRGAIADSLHEYAKGATIGPGTVGGGGVGNADDTFVKLRNRAARMLDGIEKRRHDALEGNNADPAMYVQDHPQVRLSFQRLQQTGQEAAHLEAISRSPDAAARASAMRTDAMQNFSRTIMGMQGALGVGRDYQHILIRGDANTGVGALGMVDQLEKSAEPTAVLTAWRGLYGTAWPQIFKDLVQLGKLPPQWQAVEGVYDPDRKESANDAKILAQTITESTKDGKTSEAFWSDPNVLGKAVGGRSNYEVIKSQVAENAAIADWTKTLAAQGVPRQQAQAMTDAVTMLAFGNRYYRHMGPEAASEAIKSFTDRYEFENLLRIPKKNYDDFTNNRALVLGNLKDLVQIPPGVGEVGRLSVTDYLLRIQNNPQFYNSSDGSAAQMRDSNGATVMGKDGQPLQIPFNLPRIENTQTYGALSPPAGKAPLEELRKLGARQSPQNGKWYVADQGRPGKFQEVSW